MLQGVSLPCPYQPAVVQAVHRRVVGKAVLRHELYDVRCCSAGHRGWQGSERPIRKEEAGCKGVSRFLGGVLPGVVDVLVWDDQAGLGTMQLMMSELVGSCEALTHDRFGGVDHDERLAVPKKVETVRPSIAEVVADKWDVY